VFDQAKYLLTFPRAFGGLPNFVAKFGAMMFAKVKSFHPLRTKMSSLLVNMSQLFSVYFQGID
jgi:hypothetical protein